MIITIDGPAGAGKSTVARRLAERLGFGFLDTGAMYRGVTWACLERGVDLDDQTAVVELACGLDIRFAGDQVLVDDRDITQEIRTAEVTSASRQVAANVGVREILVDLQRKAVGEEDFVSEGRDQGTVVFPQAEFKFYVTASPQSRAERRQQELAAKGQTLTVEEVLADQNDRDRRDAAREVGPLKPAADAIEIDTSDIDAATVVDRLVGIVTGAG